MEVKVTGCIDCPLFDETGSEYGTYCHHPKRLFSVELFISDEKGGIKQLPVPESEYDKYDEEAKKRNAMTRKERREEESRMPWRSIDIENAPIEEDEDFNPITPEWCPLKKESITISIEK